MFVEPRSAAAGDEGVFYGPVGLQRTAAARISSATATPEPEDATCAAQVPGAAVQPLASSPSAGGDGGRLLSAGAATATAVAAASLRARRYAPQLARSQGGVGASYALAAGGEGSVDAS